jgi:hypothetical protein
LLLLVAAAAAVAAVASAASSASGGPGSLLLLDDIPTESDALAAGLGYVPSTDPSGMILLPRPLSALPLAEGEGKGERAGRVAVLAAAAAAPSSSSSSQEAERAEAAELADQEEEEGQSSATSLLPSAGRRWAMAFVGAAAPPPLRRLLLGEEGRQEKEHDDATTTTTHTTSSPQNAYGPQTERDYRHAFSQQVRRELDAALAESRALFPDGDFPAPVAAAAAARVLSASTPEELRVRSVALGEAKRRLLGYSTGFASPCGPSCAPGACLPAVNPYTYGGSGSGGGGYLPGYFGNNGGSKYLKYYNGNGVVGLYR